MRSISVRMACQPCRDKRAKCNGRHPCERCVNKSIPCVFASAKVKSKGELRNEVESLRRSNHQSDVLLNTLASLTDLEAYSILNRSTNEDGTLDRGQLEHLLQSSETNSFKTINNNASSASSREITNLSLSTLHPLIKNEIISPTSTAYGNVSTPATSLSSFIEEAFEVGSSQQVYTGVAPALTITRVLDLLGPLIQRDYFPFCFIHKNSFLQSFVTDSSEYCSPALVYALLGLATVDQDFIQQLQKQQQQQQQIPLPSSSTILGNNSQIANIPSSQELFSEAHRLIQLQTLLSESLPSIQALGILSLYQAGSGQQKTAQILAAEFVEQMTEYCTTNETLDPDSPAMIIQTISYCGAILLLRLLQLLDNHPPSININSRIHDIISNSHEAKAQYLLQHASDEWGPKSNYKHGLILAKLFYLVEWIYQAVMVLPKDDITYASHLTIMYTRCLGWYQEIFTLLQTDTSSSASLAFVHILYQFCLLRLFRYRPRLKYDDNTINPTEICRQSAESILSLSKSYAKAVRIKGTATVATPKVYQIHPNASAGQLGSVNFEKNVQVNQTSSQMQIKVEEGNNIQLAEHLPHLLLLISEYASRTLVDLEAT